MPGRKCTVCSHQQHESINGLLVAGALSNRRIADDFGLTERAVRAHRHNHLAKRLADAVASRAKRGRAVAKSFIERHEHLNEEALQYVEDAKGSIKMQKVTVERPVLENGKLVLVPYVIDGVPQLDGKDQPIMVPLTTTQEVYREFRDVGAMSPALTVAANLNRQFGEATGVFLKDEDNKDRKPFVIIVSGTNVAIASQPSQSVEMPPALESITIDVKALGN